MATVKVSERTYRKLNELAGKLRTRLGKPVSLDEALDYIMNETKPRPSDSAGTWSMTDEEEAKILKELEEHWSRWKHRKE
ncbi:MAG: hypothetical protein HY619_02115 [Thaumarchaeota archaeon]|nr:hypothetical protein [Nitrososphaerota archaeon]